MTCTQGSWKDIFPNSNLVCDEHCRQTVRASSAFKPQRWRATQGCTPHCFLCPGIPELLADPDKSPGDHCSSTGNFSKLVLGKSQTHMLFSGQQRNCTSILHSGNHCNSLATSQLISINRTSN